MRFSVVVAVFAVVVFAAVEVAAVPIRGLPAPTVWPAPLVRAPLHVNNNSIIYFIAILMVLELIEARLVPSLRPPDLSLQSASYDSATLYVSDSFMVKTNSNSDIVVQATLRFSQVIQQTRYVRPYFLLFSLGVL